MTVGSATAHQHGHTDRHKERHAEGQKPVHHAACLAGARSTGTTSVTCSSRLPNFMT